MSSPKFLAPKNPRGFPDRLRALMAGRGWTSRDVTAAAEAAGRKVSHMAVEAWLKDDSRAGDEQVEVVAGLFGWTVPELLYGHPNATTMDRVAQLEGALGQAQRAVAEASAVLAAVLRTQAPPADGDSGGGEAGSRERRPDPRPPKVAPATSRAGGRK